MGGPIFERKGLGNRDHVRGVVSMEQNTGEVVGTTDTGPILKGPIVQDMLGEEWHQIAAREKCHVSVLIEI